MLIICKDADFRTELQMLVVGIDDVWTSCRFDARCDRLADHRVLHPEGQVAPCACVDRSFLEPGV